MKIKYILASIDANAILKEDTVREHVRELEAL